MLVQTDIENIIQNHHESERNKLDRAIEIHVIHAYMQNVKIIANTW